MRRLSTYPRLCLLTLVALVGCYSPVDHDCAGEPVPAALCADLHGDEEPSVDQWACLAETCGIKAQFDDGCATLTYAQSRGIDPLDATCIVAWPNADDDAVGASSPSAGIGTLDDGGASASDGAGTAMSADTGSLEEDGSASDSANSNSDADAETDPDADVGETSSATDVGDDETTGGDESADESSGSTTDPGQCDPGESEKESESCGWCGTRTRSRECSDEQTWSEWSSWSNCSDEGSCDPGSMMDEHEACEDCGSRTRTLTCSDACEWTIEGAWSQCDATPVCFPGDTQVDPVPMVCGNCGNSFRSRTCADDGCSWGPWGPYGECSGEGECRPQATQAEDESCGMCGERERRRECQADCSWGNWGGWGSCSGQSGECVPGRHETQRDLDCGACDGVQDRTRSCTDACRWTQWDYTPCEECRDGRGLDLCNEIQGVCECDASSCIGGETCCLVPEGLALPNTCIDPSSMQCPRVSCVQDEHCEPGYVCKNSMCERL